MRDVKWITWMRARPRVDSGPVASPGAVGKKAYIAQLPSLFHLVGCPFLSCSEVKSMPHLSWGISFSSQSLNASS